MRRVRVVAGSSLARSLERSRSRYPPDPTPHILAAPLARTRLASSTSPEGLDLLPTSPASSALAVLARVTLSTHGLTRLQIPSPSFEHRFSLASVSSSTRTTGFFASSFLNVPAPQVPCVSRSIGRRRGEGDVLGERGGDDRTAAELARGWQCDLKGGRGVWTGKGGTDQATRARETRGSKKDADGEGGIDAERRRRDGRSGGRFFPSSVGLSSLDRRNARRVERLDSWMSKEARNAKYCTTTLCWRAKTENTTEENRLKRV